MDDRANHFRGDQVGHGPIDEADTRLDVARDHEVRRLGEQYLGTEDVLDARLGRHSSVVRRLSATARGARGAAPFLTPGVGLACRDARDQRKQFLEGHIP
ncbi:hypothetical protein [Cystobacter fuscus]|uniref:hypothetical protein n=1 Tax=Cystobacter fuscus TaxID=43 RepID=UPI0012FDB3B5|nr:hypothetical protein [Cystobacter fuscus]